MTDDKITNEQWEYTVIELVGYWDDAEQQGVKQLNKLGSQGWELVQIDRGTNLGHHYCFFKRRLS